MSNVHNNHQRFLGVEEVYNKARPLPPKILLRLLPQLAQLTNPALLVDLGCGTGLSTRMWTKVAKEVIGVDPSKNMIDYSKNLATEESVNVRYIKGDSSNIGLPDGCADILTVIQAIHWMDPDTATAEFYRVLRERGVLAILNSNLLPIVDADTELAFHKFWRQVNFFRKELNVEADFQRWKIDQHFEKIQQSSNFKYIRKVNFHTVENGNTDRFIQLCHSIGRVKQLLDRGLSEEDIGLATLQSTIQDKNKEEEQVWIFNFEGFIAIKE